MGGCLVKRCNLSHAQGALSTGQPGQTFSLSTPFPALLAGHWKQNQYSPAEKIRKGTLVKTRYLFSPVKNARDGQWKTLSRLRWKNKPFSKLFPGIRCDLIGLACIPSFIKLNPALSQLCKKKKVTFCVAFFALAFALAFSFAALKIIMSQMLFCVLLNWFEIRFINLNDRT